MAPRIKLGVGEFLAQFVMAMAAVGVAIFMLYWLAYFTGIVHIMRLKFS
jgi:hypothetical protein